MKVLIDLDSSASMQILSGTAFKFMFEFMKYADSEGIIDLTAYRKEAILTKLGHSKSALIHSLYLCAKSGVLNKVRNGTYKINPNIFTIK